MKQKANEADQESDLREAFKIFDRDKDGLIDLKELKTVATMLGSMLTKEEVEEFMREADVVSKIYYFWLIFVLLKLQLKNIWNLILNIYNKIFAWWCNLSH